MFGDFGNLDIKVSGEYTIKLSYAGINGFTASNTQKITVINADVTAPTSGITDGQVSFDFRDNHLITLLKVLE